MAKYRNRKTLSLKDVLDDMIQEMRIGGKMNEMKVRKYWHELMGGFISNHTKSIYYKNGKLALVGLFEDGEQKGRNTWYHQNGIKKESGKYAGGVKHGVWRTYDKMGEVTEEIQYKNGEIYKINGFKAEPAELI